MGDRRKKHESRLFRLKCLEHMAAGQSVSKIAKLTGKSYQHTRRICGQILSEMESSK